MITLRQIEVIRAIMIAGTVNGAAKLLNVSAPGVSRVVKHAESMLGVHLFERRGGRFVQTPEAKVIFDQINRIHLDLDNLRGFVNSLKRGTSSVISMASVPSIGQFVMPRVIARIRKRYPDLLMNIDILKIEEAIDYLLLRRGELVAVSYRLDHPGIRSIPLVEGELVAIVPTGHPLASRREVSLAEIAQYPLIGTKPDDPYGRIIADAFRTNNCPFDLTVRVRFAQTALSLVALNVGVAVIDEFSVATQELPGIVRLPIRERTLFQAYVAVNADIPESMFTKETIHIIRDEMELAVRTRVRDVARAAH
jgi:DNA-binding transcriptional LysR family regulator